jgi:hypothetical protein
MAKRAADEEGEVPKQFPNVPPPEFSAGAGHARLVVEEVKHDIRDIKSDQKTDFRIVVAMYGAGFLALAVGLLSGYMILDGKLEKLNDRMDRRTDALSIKLDTLSNTAIRADTKLQDLLDRIPPTQIPAPAPAPARR